MCAKYYLDQHSDKEFIRVRTRKLLVLSTIGILVLGWVQGYFNMAIGDAIFQHTGGNAWDCVILAYGCFRYGSIVDPSDYVGAFHGSASCAQAGKRESLPVGQKGKSNCTSWFRSLLYIFLFR